MINRISFGSKYSIPGNQPSAYKKHREFFDYGFDLETENKDVKLIADGGDRVYPIYSIYSPNEQIDGLIESYCTSKNIKIIKTDDEGNESVCNEAEVDKRIKKQIADIEAGLKAKGTDFQTCSAAQLFDELGINYKKDEKGLLILDSYEQPNDFTYSDIGVDENRLFRDIVEIKGPVSFFNSNATNLGSLERIGKAYVSFTDTDVEDIGNLKTVQGGLGFSRSKVKSVNGLEHVYGHIYIEDSLLTKDMFKNIIVEGGIIE